MLYQAERSNISFDSLLIASFCVKDDKHNICVGEKAHMGSMSCSDLVSMLTSVSELCGNN